MLRNVLLKKPTIILYHNSNHDNVLWSILYRSYKSRHSCTLFTHLAKKRTPEHNRQKLLQSRSFVCCFILYCNWQTTKRIYEQVTITVCHHLLSSPAQRDQKIYFVNPRPDILKKNWPLYVVNVGVYQTHAYTSHSYIHQLICHCIILCIWYICLNCMRSYISCIVYKQQLSCVCVCICICICIWIRD